MNQVTIIGRLGKDPELRNTASGSAVTTLTVATSERRKGADGEYTEATEWHNCVLWGKQAENACKYLTKGSQVGISGRLQTRSWETQTQEKRYTTEIVVNQIEYLSPVKKDDDTAVQQPQPKQEENFYDIPF